MSGQAIPQPSEEQINAALERFRVQKEAELGISLTLVKTNDGPISDRDGNTTSASSNLDVVDQVEGEAA